MSALSAATRMTGKTHKSKNPKQHAALDGLGVTYDRDIATWGRLGHLSESQAAALKSLSSRAGSFPDDDPLLARCNVVAADGTNAVRNMLLLRMLRAREFDVDEAERLLDSVVAWRRANKPWMISADEIARPEAPFHLYNTGARDLANRPVLYAVQRHMRRSAIDSEAFQRAAISFLEALLTNMPATQDQFVVLYDFEGFSAIRHVPLGAVQGMFRVLQDAYPETLARVYMLPNYPFSFYAVFSVVRKFIEPFTAAKLEFMSEETYKDDLIRDVGHLALPTWLGGANVSFRLDEC
jgi:CRAL/TRIO domain